MSIGAAEPVILDDGGEGAKRGKSKSVKIWACTDWESKEDERELSTSPGFRGHRSRSGFLVGLRDGTPVSTGVATGVGSRVAIVSLSVVDGEK